MEPTADKIGDRANPRKEMRCVSLMLGGNETGAIVAEPGAKVFTCLPMPGGVQVRHRGRS